MIPVSRVCCFALGLMMCFILVLSAVPNARATDAASKKMRIGITLHPYYSFASNIVGDHATVVPLIDAGFNPHSYVPKPDDMKRIMTLDALIVNGIGHDEWAFEVVEASGLKDKLPLIYANDGVALIPVAGDQGDTKIVNPHTFIATTAAIQQVYTIARKLGAIDPYNATYYSKNARKYAMRLRRMKAKYMKDFSKLDVSNFRCATMHGAYGYLMQEFGLHVAAVIEPRHGVKPSPSQMARTIDAIEKANVSVLFAEKFFASKLADTIREATGVRMYSFSHITGGEYEADKFEREMEQNLITLRDAIRSVSEQ
ncbi:MAG: metal ABC transporter solute-binding protein, Zn/Mn family [Halodesulfovibrio sp.]|uniref:metal ABC transporter solute-binding protein, Zn/Mn family n=1 Tax=Halodesulfovibrio sp. TaxID=1912772 RepID=UPI00359D0684